MLVHNRSACKRDNEDEIKFVRDKELHVHFFAFRKVANHYQTINLNTIKKDPDKQKEGNEIIINKAIFNYSICGL